ncbi:sugar ABC transporter permease [Leifsonia sp. H3M29-4]|uniref:carbohydrate ABC transporter permease n=1 Tax=Salinibacterium metalliresistens TaxID=3031321 RepID=UPI0023DACF12|nr:sugar ABC transporter permease [Salinibacterium metalliresistens]MDF1478280.1 sugar ABC transporter permease [Salinibacterium metalliresistens]
MKAVGRRKRLTTGVGLPWGTSMMFVLPALALFAVFILYPLLTALGYSFFNWRGTVNDGFSWLDNYVTVFTRLPYKDEIAGAFAHNILLFLGAMVFQNTVGLGLAALLHRIGRLKRFFQTVYTLPYLVSPLVIGYLWSLMLSPLFGPVNALLKAVGLGDLARPWLGDPQTAIWVVVLVTAWQWIGFPILLYGAALGGVPEELNEAASLDGATSWQRFRHITLPLLVPAIGTVSILTFIGAMEAFPIPYALGGSTGSPAGATDVMSLLFYRTAFESGSNNAIGVSSAIATLLFLCIFGVAMLMRWYLDTREKRMY